MGWTTWTAAWWRACCATPARRSPRSARRWGCQRRRSSAGSTACLASGAVRGFTALVDPAVLGWTTEAYVELYCKGTVSPQDLRRSLEKVPEVVSACTVSGSADALVHMLASDVHHLEQALERVRDERNVDHTRSVIVLSRLIDRSRS